MTLTPMAVCRLVRYVIMRVRRSTLLDTPGQWLYSSCDTTVARAGAGEAARGASADADRAQPEQIARPGHGDEQLSPCDLRGLPVDGAVALGGLDRRSVPRQEDPLELQALGPPIGAQLDRVARPAVVALQPQYRDAGPGEHPVVVLELAPSGAQDRSVGQGGAVRRGMVADRLDQQVV